MGAIKRSAHKQSNQNQIETIMSSSDTSDVEMKPRRRIKRKNSMDGQYRPSQEYEVPSKPKQLHKPKQPTSAYFLYANDVRAETRANNPDLKMTEIAKVISKAWKEESDETKEPFMEEAKKLKEEYAIKRKEYVEGPRYKKWKRDLAKWNDRYKEEWQEQQEEKKLKREEAKKKRAARKAKKEKKAQEVGSDDDDDEKDDEKENKKKKKKKTGNNKGKKKTTAPAKRGRGRPKKK